jgi:hypothetical protein
LGSGIVSMRCRPGAGISASGGCRPSASFSLLLGEMLRFLSLLGCTKIVQTKCDSVETIENIESEFGGASRDRTDDLIVANDGVRRIISLTCLHLSAEYGSITVQFKAWPCAEFASLDIPPACRDRASYCYQRPHSPCKVWHCKHLPIHTLATCSV